MSVFRIDNKAVANIQKTALKNLVAMIDGNEEFVQMSQTAYEVMKSIQKLDDEYYIKYEVQEKFRGKYKIKSTFFTLEEAIEFAKTLKRDYIIEMNDSEHNRVEYFEK